MKEKTETSVVGRWLQDVNELETHMVGMQEDAKKRLNEMETRIVERREDATKRRDSNLNALQRAINTFKKNFMNHVDRVKSESEALKAHVWGTQAEMNAWHERFKV